MVKRVRPELLFYCVNQIQLIFHLKVVDVELNMLFMVRHVWKMPWLKLHVQNLYWAIHLAIANRRSL